VPPLILVLVFVLASCGQSEQTPATPVTTTVSATAPADADGRPSGGTPIAGAESGATALTFGDLAARVDAAWLGVGSYRAILATQRSQVGTPIGAAASPVVGVDGDEFVREIVLPDSQRQVVRRGETVVAEAVAVGGRLWVRGKYAQPFMRDVRAGAWVEISPATLPAGDPLTSLLAPARSPLAGLPENLRPQAVRELGPVESEGRTCQVYGAANTTEIGGRIDYTIALGPDDLPCFIESRTATAGARTVYDAYGEPLAIAPPAESIAATTPIAGATPATPIGRD